MGRRMLVLMIWIVKRGENTGQSWRAGVETSIGRRRYGHASDATPRDTSRRTFRRTLSAECVLPSTVRWTALAGNDLNAQLVWPRREALARSGE